MDLDIISWILFALVVGVVLYIGLRLLRQRMDHLRYQEELAELEFQESLLSNINTAALDDDNRFVQAEAVAAVTDEPASIAPKSSSSEVTGPLPADVAAAGAMKQLDAAGIVTAIDGYIAVHGNAKGAALLRLRNGKTALLVPQTESETFLRHHARRADFIIMAGQDGRAVVVNTLESFLAEMISPA